MAWYMILLYIFAGIIGLGCFIWVLGRLFRPKIKYKPSLQTADETIVKEEPKVETTKPITGLSLDNKLSLDEESVEERVEENLDEDEEIRFDKNEYDNFRRRLTQKHNKKSLIEQIRELSPELKVLIFDKGLARKDFDIMSKKD